MDALRLESLLAVTARLGATALHMVPGRPPALRVQRRFVAGDDQPVTAEEVADLTRDMMFSDHRRRLERAGHVEVLYVARSGERYRATIALADGATSLVLRPLPAESPRLATLELPPQVEDFTRCRRGLVAVGGFFGSGKSQTLAAIVDALNGDGGRHIVSIEESIQFVHRRGEALLHQREIGTHVSTSAAGVREAVAVGADVIALAAIRDYETLDAALAAAESGCLVFAGVEAGSIPGVLAGMCSLAEMSARAGVLARLANNLLGCTSQCLLHRQHRGGRVPVVEVLLATAAVRSAVAEGRLDDLEQLMRDGRGLGMQTLDVALRGLLNRHLVTTEEALLHAGDREQVLAPGQVR